MVIAVRAGVLVPRGVFDDAGMEEHLTVKHQPMGAKAPVVVEAFEDRGTHVLVPRQYGLKSISTLGLEAKDCTARGRKIELPAVKHSGEYAYQEPFVRDIVTASKGYSDFLVRAATGKGKTVCSLSAIQRIGRTALIVVDQDNLKEQWIAEVGRHFGLAREDIGIVQGKECTYEGKAITVAMMQTLYRKKFPEEMYRYFGVVCFDESHTTGAPAFSTVLLQFPAHIRFGVSATIDRRDALQKVIHANLGEVRAELTDKHSKSYVYYVESDTVYSWYATISPKTGRILTEVGEDTNRNQTICEMIKWAYDNDRDTLALSDRIEQLEVLRVMCIGLGIPQEDVGLYCGQRSVWGMNKDPVPKRKPVGYVRGCEYSPVKYAAVKKKIPRKELQEVLRKSRVILATYGMFAKGVDVPRLSVGIDCTGRSRAEQVHGRILRVRDGKYVPLWITIRDVNCYRLDYQFGNRVREYVASSAEIYKWKIGKGIRKVALSKLRSEVRENVKELRQLEIRTRLDGRNTLVIPQSAKK